MADFEEVCIDPEKCESTYTKSDYAQVIFNGIAEVYSVGNDVKCHYTVTPLLVPESRDWVGLYKVGWRSPKDYIYFEWSPTTKDSESGSEQHYVITFKAKSLPDDDGEFYQFCYVTAGGQVRGASTPFQFKRPLAEEYIEVEEEDGELLVVKTRTAILQEKLNSAASKHTTLLKDVELLEKERDGLLNKLLEMQKQCAAEAEEKHAMSHVIKEHQEKIAFLATEAKDMQLAHDALREKINILNQEKECMEKRLDDNDVYLRSLQDKIKALINEKDALTGKNKSLEEEKELFKTHFTSSESTIKCYLQEAEKLKEQLTEAQIQCAQLRAQTEQLSLDLSHEKAVVTKQAKIIEADRDQIAALEEKARNAEDKLHAAEHCKVLLNDEVLNVQEVCKKVSEDLEGSKSEAYHLMSQLSQKEAMCLEETQKMSGEIARLQHMLQDMQMEKKTVEEELSKLRSEKKDKDKAKNEEAGPMYALQMAHDNLKERYVKLSRVVEDYKRQVQGFVQKQCLWEDREAELQSEIRDLKDRLLMGQEEYKRQFVNCQKLQSQLRRLSKQGVAVSDNSTSNPKEDFIEVRAITTDQATECEDQPKVTACTLTDASQTGNKGSQTEAKESGPAKECASQATEVNSDDLTAAEMRQQIDELALELHQRRSKKQKYKHMLQEEKSKNHFLQRYYFDELRKKDAEVKQLTEQLIQTEDAARIRIEKLEEKLKSTKVIKSQPNSPVTVPQCIYPNPYAGYTPSNPKNPPAPSSPTPPKDVKEFDPLITEGGSSGLQRPLQPLPPPMTPQMTQGAKVAAIRAQQTGGVGLNGILDLCKSFDEHSSANAEQTSLTESVAPPPENPPTHSSPSHKSADADLDEEIEFVDAQVEPQRVCPICNVPFTSDATDCMIADHIEDHYGPVCPICHKQFPRGHDQRELQIHVESHF